MGGTCPVHLLSCNPLTELDLLLSFVSCYSSLSSRDRSDQDVIRNNVLPEMSRNVGYAIWQNHILTAGVCGFSISTCGLAPTPVYAKQ